MIPWKAKGEFQKLKSEKRWILALLAVFVPGLLSLTGSMLIQQKTQDLAMQMVEDMGLAETQMEAVQNIQGFILAIGVVIGILSIPLFWVLKSVVFHVLSRILGSKEGGVASTMHLIAYTYLPFIFKGIIDLFKGLVYEAPTFEEYMQEMRPDLFLTLFRTYNIFFWWAFILMVIAVREQYNLSKKKAVLIILLPYAAAGIIQVALTYVGMQLGGAQVAGS